MYTATGVKLQVIHETDMSLQAATVMATAPFNAQDAEVKTTDYIGNKVYENNVLKRILIDGGYIEGGVYYYYLTDHLGNNRVVANASGTVIQRNHYYPFGMSFADTPLAEQGKQPYKYNNKELDMMHGLNMYDYSARHLALDVPRFTTVDPHPHAENYYSVSPYAYVANNPIMRTDPTGMDWYFFNGENGDYMNKREKEGNHRIVVKSTDKDGNIKYSFYDFADPKNDSKDIDDGKINRFEMLSESDVRGIINGEGGFNMSNSGLGVFGAKSFGGNSFDYSMNYSGGMSKYMREKGKSSEINSSLYIANGDTYAHNRMNFGNFLWGATGYTLGYSQETLLKAADFNSRYNPGRRNGYVGQPDSADDQLSISRGTEYAKKNLYRYKTNPSWLGKLLKVFR